MNWNFRAEWRTDAKRDECISLWEVSLKRETILQMTQQILPKATLAAALRCFCSTELKTHRGPWYYSVLLASVSVCFLFFFGSSHHFCLSPLLSHLRDPDKTRTFGNENIRVSSAVVMTWRNTRCFDLQLRIRVQKCGNTHRLKRWEAMLQVVQRDKSYPLSTPSFTFNQGKELPERFSSTCPEEGWCLWLFEVDLVYVSTCCYGALLHFCSWPPPPGTRIWQRGKFALWWIPAASDFQQILDTTRSLCRSKSLSWKAFLASQLRAVPFCMKPLLLADP